MGGQAHRLLIALDLHTVRIRAFLQSFCDWWLRPLWPTPPRNRMGTVGSSLSRSVRGYMSRNERRLLLLGLDRAGKTTISQQIKTANTKAQGSSSTTIPAGAGSSGVTVETFKHGRITFHLWDVGGEEKLRPYWRHYYTGTQGVVFVVDASDRERLPLAALELRSLANDEQLADAAIAVAVNKTDAPGALSVTEVQEAMGLSTVLKDHPWQALPTSAVSGTGLEDVWRFLAERTRPI